MATGINSRTYFQGAWHESDMPVMKAADHAMWLGSSGSFGGLLQKDLGFEFSATMLPYWEGVTKEPTQTFIGGAALFAMAGKSAEENKATAEFFKFLTAPETQYFWHKETGYVPITQAAYEAAADDGHYERFPAAEVGIKQLTLPAGDHTKGYRMGFYVQIRDIINEELEAVWAGDKSAQEAMDAAVERGNELLRRFEATNS